MLPLHDLVSTLAALREMRLSSSLLRYMKLGYSDRNVTFEEMCAEDRQTAFNRPINDENHVVHKHLPSSTTASRVHNATTFEDEGTRSNYLNTALA